MHCQFHLPQQGLFLHIGSPRLDHALLESVRSIQKQCSNTQAVEVAPAEGHLADGCRPFGGKCCRFPAGTDLEPGLRCPCVVLTMASSERSWTEKAGKYAGYS